MLQCTDTENSLFHLLRTKVNVKAAVENYYSPKLRLNSEGIYCIKTHFCCSYNLTKIRGTMMKSLETADKRPSEADRCEGMGAGKE